MGLDARERVVKVFAESEAELAAWGVQHQLKPEWMDRRRPEAPHYDLFRDGLRLVPPDAPVLTPTQVKARVRAERAARAGKPLLKRARDPR
jgi:hypothetical protein